MDTMTCTKAVQAAINKLGSGFMMDGGTFARASEVGLDPGLAFYVAGRFGALGRVHCDVVASAGAFFSPDAVAGYWADVLAKSDPVAAGAVFFDCADQWGRAKLAGVAGLDRLNELAARVVDSASPVAAPLVAALRAQPRTTDPAGLAVQLSFCMRELRMARHVVGVLAEGLTPLEAILSGPGGEGNAKMFGWTEPFADASGLAERRARAEAITDAVHAVDFAVLTDGERAELAVGYAAAFAAVS
jgi:hypothetical protein